MFWRILISLGLGLMSIGLNAGVDIALVGSDEAHCTHSSIQAALDDEYPYVRVVSGTFIETLNIGYGVSLRGGFESCEAAAAGEFSDLDERTVLDGLNMLPLINIYGSDLSVSLIQFNVQNGRYLMVPHPPAPGPYTVYRPSGGINIIGDNLTLIINGSEIAHNEGYLGGGIYSRSYSTGTQNNDIVVYSGVRIHSNQAVSGGGVYVDKTNLEINEGAGIYGNQAFKTASGLGGDGGGLFAKSSTVDLRSGIGELSGDGESVQKGVSNNTATSKGGGVFLDSTRFRFINSELSEVVPSIVSNHVIGDVVGNRGMGGGLYASGSLINYENNGSKYAPALYLAHNQVLNGDGGGMYLNDTQFANSPYSDQSPYLVISNNKAYKLGGVNTKGGAVYVDESSTFGEFSGAEPQYTYRPIKAIFENNLADRASAIYISNDARADIQNSYFIGHSTSVTGEDSMVDGFSVVDVLGQANISFSTFANNNTDVILNIPSIMALLNLKTTIISDNPTTTSVMGSSFGTFNSECNLFHESQSFLNAIGPHSDVTESPGFVDENNGDYHLTQDSIAVDRCSSFIDVPGNIIKSDMDNNQRPFDAANISNGLGEYDAGADEFIDDLIFKDGFEN